MTLPSSLPECMWGFSLCLRLCDHFSQDVLFRSCPMPLPLKSNSISRMQQAFGTKYDMQEDVSYLQESSELQRQVHFYGHLDENFRSVFSKRSQTWYAERIPMILPDFTHIWSISSVPSLREDTIKLCKVEILFSFFLLPYIQTTTMICWILISNPWILHEL